MSKMRIASVRDNENNVWKVKGKNKGRKKQRVVQGIAKVWELSDFSVFKLGFAELICKASFIFKSNLELDLNFLNYFKTKRIIQVSMLWCSVDV